ncbi:MAG: hypothetical protein ABH837_02780 [bacterium]
MVEGEPGFLSEEADEKKPTVDNAIEACRSFFEDEEGHEIEVGGESFANFQEILSGMEFGDALGYLFGWLTEQGKDPEEFLIEKGILEAGEGTETS